MRWISVAALVMTMFISTTAQAAPPGLPAYLLRAQSAAPHEGTPAPDFTLKKLGSDEVVTLSTLTGRPVALVFGSYT